MSAPKSAPDFALTLDGKAGYVCGVPFAGDDFVVGVWDASSPAVHWLGVLIRRGDGSLTGVGRLRLGAGTKDPFDGADFKKGYIGSYAPGEDDRATADMLSVAAEFEKKWPEAKVDYIPVGKGESVKAALSKAANAHMQFHPGAP